MSTARLHPASSPLVAGLLWSIALAAAVATAALAQSHSKPAAKATPARATPKSLTVYVDRKTLELDLTPGAGRAALELTPDILEALNTSSDGLQATTRNGITSVDLRGRFEPVWFVVKGADGKPHPFCLTSLPAPVEAAAKVVREANEALHGR